MEEKTLNVLRLIMDNISEASVYSIGDDLKVFPMGMFNECRREYRERDLTLKNSEKFTRADPYFIIKGMSIYSLTSQDRDKFIEDRSKEIIKAYNEYEKELSSESSHNIKRLIVSSYTMESNHNKLGEINKHYQIVENVNTIDKVTEYFYRTEIIDIFKKLTENEIKVLKVSGKIYLLQKI